MIGLLTKKPTNSSKESAEAHGLITSIRSENLIVMDLPAIKQIYDEHRAETKKIYDEHIQKLEAKNDEYIQKLEAKNKEHKEEIVKLTVKQKDDESNFTARSEEVFKLRRVSNIRSALEYIRGWVSFYVSILFFTFYLL